MTLTNHQYNPQSVVISKKFWDSAGRRREEGAAGRRHRVGQVPARAVARRRRHHPGRAEEGGMQVTELPPAEIAKLRDKMKPVIAKHSAGIEIPPSRRCRPSWPRPASKQPARAAARRGMCPPRRGYRFPPRRAARTAGDERPHHHPGPCRSTAMHRTDRPPRLADAFAFKAPMIYNPYFESVGINAVVVPMGPARGLAPCCAACSRWRTSAAR
jgi:hypothetical protein